MSLVNSLCLCGTVFSAQKSKHQKYCSVRCANKYKLRMKGFPLGTEKIRKVGSNGDLCVKIKTKEGWKRKAVVLIEILIQRKLKKWEASKIIYLDGDRTNCVIANLILPGADSIPASCSVCGKERKTIRTKTSYCKTCWCAIMGRQSSLTFQSKRYRKKKQVKYL